MDISDITSEGFDEKSREVRLGLVMYGGVSLAIYINGVAYEFFRAVRGRGVYRLIKALTDSDIVVDVMSGTSAGGINGIMLGYALCNQRDFADSATLWRMHGGLEFEKLEDPKKAQWTDPAVVASWQRELFDLAKQGVAIPQGALVGGGLVAWVGRR